MTAVPRSVSRIQSPWRQTPGYIEKYASRSREPSGSSQNATGIDGIGAVSTSSPTSPITALAGGVERLDLGAERPALQLAPYTGSTGTPPTNAVQTSVPPLIEKSQVSSPSSS